MRSTFHSWSNQLIVAGLALVGGLAALYGYVRFAEPAPREHRAPFRDNFDRAPFDARFVPARFAAHLAAIEAAGQPAAGRTVGRLTGSAGCDDTAAHIAATFATAGLSVTTQRFEVAVPVTERCELLAANGQPLPGVSLYPFEPNGLSVVEVPPEGLCGRLLVAETAELKYLAGCDPTNTIVVTNLDGAGGWAALASLGVKAVIVVEDELSARLRAPTGEPAPWVNLLSPQSEVSFPRFLARGPILAHAGQEVRLFSRVAWQARTARNLIARLPGRTGAREALVLNAYYDSYSVVPDLAPGAEAALPLAALLQLAEALAPYAGDLPRDVLFVATAGHAQNLAGASHLMEAIGFGPRADRYLVADLASRLNDQQAGLAHAAQALAWIEAPEVRDRGMPPEARRLAWERQDPSFRSWFERQLKQVMGEINLEAKEAVLAARLDYLRADSPIFRSGFDPRAASEAARKDPANSHPLLQALVASQDADNRTGNLVSMPIWHLAGLAAFEELNVPGRLRRHLTRCADDHTRHAEAYADQLDVRRLFATYENTFTLNLELNSGGPKGLTTLSHMTGLKNYGSGAEPQASELAQALLAHIPEQAPGRPLFNALHWGPKDAEGSREQPNIHQSDLFLVESQLWTVCGRLAFSLHNADFQPPRLGTPEDTFTNLSTVAVERQLAAIGPTVLDLAHGRLPFKRVPGQQRKNLLTLRGGVFGNAGTGSTYPTHPMGEATVVRAFRANLTAQPEATLKSRNVRACPVLLTAPDGRYEQAIAPNLVSVAGWSEPVNVDAARFDGDGRLRFFKNASETGGAFRNKDVPSASIQAVGMETATPINVGMFRCHRVQLFDRSNPKTLKQFRAAAFLSQQGLSAPAALREDPLTIFLDPAYRFFVAMQDSSSGNEQVLAYRAFLLNANETAPASADEPEIFGEGYLAADVDVLTLPHLHAAASMLRTNAKRLNLLARNQMSDELMHDFHNSGATWLESARRLWREQDAVGSVLAASRSLAYSINNHPVIRRKVAQAVTGVIWYLGLLVPFVFFFEKLVFGFTDIRKQLLAAGLIFLTVFGLLRWLHPAFQMVRSSIMILIGFVMLLLTLLVMGMVSGKFMQNVRTLRRHEGRVEGADVNRGGVVGTAFMLGLNNMRRRKVRTGLTCVTLVLITVVIICFTSVSTDFADIEYATARSTWNGILLRNANFKPVTDGEVGAIRQTYGHLYPVAQTSWLQALVREDRIQNAEIQIDREYQVGEQIYRRRARVSATVQCDWNEPSFSGLDRFLRSQPRWFPRPPQTRAERLAALERNERPRPMVILPDNVARDLDVTPAELAATNVLVNIRGDEYEVIGILDAQAVDRTMGLDGRAILPYDLNSVQVLVRDAAGTLLVPDDARPLPAAQVIFVNRHPPLKADSERTFIASVGILFPRTAYRTTPDAPERPAVTVADQRLLVKEYLERTAEPAYYAVDGVAYYGTRKRARSFDGLVELLIPILLAALTVFNTMRSSVYERRSEIYVYNAVGIAPNHVFFMFMAEACVYAVVGIMCGYILSQATGNLLTSLGLTGGMNMSYGSIETIYASLAIAIAVLLSTILPARSAARLAAPSDVRSWTVPKAAGDTLSFHLPFTFTPHDRVAVLSYFHRWLDANGEGSSGPFFCSPPQVQLQEQPSETASGGLLPGIAATVWLKPYDLGVSQRLEIFLPTDAETHEYIAEVRLTRLSGTSAAWQRTVKPFLGVLRKQFLNWRAASSADREEMFAEADRLLGEVTPTPAASPATSPTGA